MWQRDTPNQMWQRHYCLQFPYLWALTPICKVAPKNVAKAMKNIFIRSLEPSFRSKQNIFFKKILFQIFLSFFLRRLNSIFLPLVPLLCEPKLHLLREWARMESQRKQQQQKIFFLLIKEIYFFHSLLQKLVLRYFFSFGFFILKKLIGSRRLLSSQPHHHHHFV